MKRPTSFSRRLVAITSISIALMGSQTLCAADDEARAEPAAGSGQNADVAPDAPAATGEESTAAAEASADGAASPAEAEPPAFDDIPWELRPYRVLISVAMADRSSMSEAFAVDLLRRLEGHIAGQIGPLWRPTLEINDWLFPQTESAVRRLDANQLTERFRAAEFDKVFIVVLQADGAGYELAGCEWDRATEGRGPIQQRKIVDRRRIAAASFELLQQLFRPIAQIDLAEETFAELRVRGGELLAQESAMFPFDAGDLLAAYFRYLDRDGNVRQIQSVPWTYLRIDGVTRSRMTSTIETAFSSPLSGSRRRVELIAIQVSPVYPQTKLSLSPRTNPGQPLVGVRVRVYSELPSEETPEPERIDLMTNRNGVVMVPAYADAPLRRLIIHSGGAVLSNVPFVPGVEAELSMQLPDDSPRLQVEGSLAMVQGDLIDLVSRRAVMLARAVSVAKQEKFAEADRLLAEVDAQPSLGSFESRILSIRVPAIDQARANHDRSQEKRIRMMCADLEKLAQKYLERDKVTAAREEVAELKKLAGN